MKDYRRMGHGFFRSLLLAFFDTRLAIKIWG